MGHLLRSLASAVVIVAAVWLGWAGYTFLQMWKPPPAKVVEVGPAILEQVRHVNKHILVEHYHTVDVAHHEAPAGLLNALKNIGIKQEFVVLLRGTVPAGIDLSEVSERDIWVSSDGRRAQIILPPPRIFVENVSIDLEHSRILSQSDFCPDFLCPSSQLEAYQEDIEPEARRRLIAAAEEHGILRQAAKDAEEYYTKLFSALGIAEVRVIIRGYSVAGE